MPNIDLIIALLSLLLVVFLERKIIRLQETLRIAYIVLGYYKARFGLVTAEDIENGTGIPKDVFEKLKEKLNIKY